MLNKQRGRRALKPQICRPLQVLPSGYTTMCGQRSSRPIAFCGAYTKVSDERGSTCATACPKAHPYLGRAQSYLQLWSRCFCPRGPQRWFAATSSAARVQAPSRKACRARQLRGTGAHQGTGQARKGTHVAHNWEAHVLSSRHANRQTAPQEEPDVRKALRARNKRTALAMELAAIR